MNVFFFFFVGGGDGFYMFLYVHFHFLGGRRAGFCNVLHVFHLLTKNNLLKLGELHFLQDLFMVLARFVCQGGGACL